jgi:hypothetical protein
MSVGGSEGILADKAISRDTPRGSLGADISGAISSMWARFDEWRTQIARFSKAASAINEQTSFMTVNPVAPSGTTG